MKATVRLLKQTDNRNKVVAEVVTNEKGRFAVADIESGKYILQAEAPNFQTLVVEIKITQGSSRNKELEIGLEVAADCCTGYAILRKTK